MTNMKAELVFWHKARLQEHYVLEMTIHQLKRSTRYPDGVKYSLILIDIATHKKVLMDNHHPKGPHMHLDHQEMPYAFLNIDRLVQDFRALILEHMGVKL